MILEEATFEAFGYYSSKLKLRSRKYVVAVCDLCGEFRALPKDGYRTFCRFCSHILGEMNKGEKNPMFAKHHTEAAKALMGSNKNKFGEKSSNYKGSGSKSKDPKEYMRLYHKKYLKTINGKIRNKKAIEKRKRDLGYTLLLPLKDGEVGHHVTDKYVIGIPEDIHIRFSGYKRKKHRALVLEWLKVNDKEKYKLVFDVLATEMKKFIYV